MKIAINSAFDVATFRKAIRNLSKLPSGGLTFYGKVLLDNTLKIMDYFLKEDNRIREDFIEKHEDYEGILIVGLMSKDTEIRKMFSNAIEEIIMTTAL